MTLPLLSAIFLFSAMGCSSASQEASAAAASAAPIAAVAPAVAPGGQGAAPAAAGPEDRVLLFFLNPAGSPCQMQKKILDDLGEDLTGRVKLRLVSVQDDANRPLLYNYGIRSLPALILVDSAGETVHRFSPGIQDAASILKALD